MSRQLKQAAKFFYQTDLVRAQIILSTTRATKISTNTKKLFSKILTQDTLWNGHWKYIICAFRSDCLKSLTFDLLYSDAPRGKWRYWFSTVLPGLLTIVWPTANNQCRTACMFYYGWRLKKICVCVWHQKFHFIRQSVNSKVMYDISLTCVSIILPPSQSSEIASKKCTHTKLEGVT